MSIRINVATTLCVKLRNNCYRTAKQKDFGLHRYMSSKCEKEVFFISYVSIKQVTNLVKPVIWYLRHAQARPSLQQAYFLIARSDRD